MPHMKTLETNLPPFVLQQSEAGNKNIWQNVMASQLQSKKVENLGRFFCWLAVYRLLARLPVLAV